MVMEDGARISSSKNWPGTVLYLALAGIVANALAYMFVNANPFLWADAWDTIRTLIIPCSRRGCHITDFFQIRGSADHSQPLHKLVFYLNSKWFHLDLRVDAYIGFVFMILSFLVLAMCFRNASSSRNFRGRTALSLVILGAIFFSLNAKDLYTWPLVTFGYVEIFICIWLASYIDRAAWDGAPTFTGVLVFSTLALFCGGDTGRLALVSVVTVLCVRCFQDPGRKRILKWISAIAASLVIHRLAIAYLSNAAVMGQGSHIFSDAGKYLVQHYNSIYKVVLYPFAQSLLMRIHYEKIGQPWASAVEIMLGTFVLLVHLSAWYLYFRDRHLRRSLIPPFLMLMSYAMVLGIMVYRVPHFGFHYFNQTRYVRGFALGLVGATWVLLASNPGCYASEWKRYYVATMRVALVSLVMLAYLLAAERSWRESGSILAYHRHEAESILQYQRTNGVHCDHYMQPVCDWNKAVAQATVGFLSANRLNVFSPVLRERYGLVRNE